MEKIKVDTVAKALGVSPETVRVGLQLGMYDFGIAFKKPGRQNYTYVLYPAKVAELVGELKQ